MTQLSEGSRGRKKSIVVGKRRIGVFRRVLTDEEILEMLEEYADKHGKSELTVEDCYQVLKGYYKNRRYVRDRLHSLVLAGYLRVRKEIITPRRGKVRRINVYTFSDGEIKTDPRFLRPEYRVEEPSELVEESSMEEIVEPEPEKKRRRLCPVCGERQIRRKSVVCGRCISLCRFRYNLVHNASRYIKRGEYPKRQIDGYRDWLIKTFFPAFKKSLEGIIRRAWEGVSEEERSRVQYEILDRENEILEMGHELAPEVIR